MRVLERLSVRLALAALSGLSIGLASDWLGSGTWLLEYGVPGALFGAGVLWPHLRTGHLLAARAVTLLVFSSVSYWAAVGTAVDLAPALGISAGYEPNLAAFLLASLVGAAIVVVPAKWLIPVPTPAPYWVLSAVAALVGAVVMYFGLASPPVRSDFLTYVAFAVWHSLLCVALHFGAKASPR
jgi:hypothetical protein